MPGPEAGAAEREVAAEPAAEAQVEATVAVAASLTASDLSPREPERAVAALVTPAKARGTDVRRPGVPESRVAPAAARVWRPGAPALAARLPATLAARLRAALARQAWSARQAPRAVPARSGRPARAVPQLAATQAAQMAPARARAGSRANEARRSPSPATRPRAGASRALYASCVPTPRPRWAGRMARPAGSARRIESPPFLVFVAAGVRRAAMHL
jgi:hypothetical protein